MKKVKNILLSVYCLILLLAGFVALALDREVEISRLSAHAARNLAAVHFVLTVNIAILAPGAYLGAAVPRIPVGIYLPIFRHQKINYHPGI